MSTLVGNPEDSFSCGGTCTYSCCIQTSKALASFCSFCPCSSSKTDEGRLGCDTAQILTHVSHVTRKPVFGVFDQVRLQQVCLATEASLSQEIAHRIETRDIILSRQQTTKVLISCCRLICAFVVRIWQKQVFS